MSIFTLFFTFTVLGCKADKGFWSYNRINRILQVSLFLVLGTCYAFAGYLLYNTLKFISFTYARGLRTRILIAVSLISVPIVARAIVYLFEILADFMKDFRKDSLSEDTWGYPIYYFTFYMFLDLLPLSFQFFSVKMILSDSKTDVMITKVMSGSVISTNREMSGNNHSGGRDSDSLDSRPSM